MEAAGYKVKTDDMHLSVSCLNPKVYAFMGSYLIYVFIYLAFNYKEDAKQCCRQNITLLHSSAVMEDVHVGPFHVFVKGLKKAKQSWWA